MFNKNKQSKTDEELWEDDVKRRQLRTHITYLLILANVAIWSFTTYKANAFYNDYTELLAESLSKRQAKEVKAAELTMKEWVLNETRKAGLKDSDVICLIEKESGWNEWALNDNANGAGVDRGLFQFSSIWHKEISNKEAFNYKEATKHFIRIAKADGNLNQWHGYTNFCR